MTNYKPGDLITVDTKKYGFLTGIVLKTYPHRLTSDGYSCESYIKVIKKGGIFSVSEESYEKSKRGKENFKGTQWKTKGVSDNSGYYIHGNDQVMLKVPCTLSTHSVEDAFHLEESQWIFPDGSIRRQTSNKKVLGGVTRVMTNSFWDERGVSNYVVVDREGFLGISDISSKSKKDLTRQAYLRAEIRRLEQEVENEKVFN